VIRSADPKRTFDRDDGSEGQVRNVRLQDDSGDIRSRSGEKADLDIGPGDEVAFVDVDVQDGWQDDIEASAGWGRRSSRSRTAPPRTPTTVATGPPDCRRSAVVARTAVATTKMRVRQRARRE